MPTETITLQYGPIGGLTSSTFSWTVTNVSATGSFVDGTPWIVVGPGAQLIDVSPKSELKTSTHIYDRTSGVGIGLTFYINGTAKNLKARYYTDPNFSFTIHGRGTTGSGKFPLDGRIQPTGDIYALGDTNAEIQQVYISRYDEASNIGIPTLSGSITPVALTGGDVIVTADCMFHRGGTLSSPEFIEFFGGATYGSDVRFKRMSNSIPNSVYNWRTGIKELGVLTVLKQAPSQPSFRPPFQWITGSEHTRPDPIPVSAVTGESPLFHNTTISPSMNGFLNNESYLRSPVFHEGHDVEFQSSNGTFAFYAGSNPTTMRSTWTYFSNSSINAHRYLTIMAFNRKYESINVPQLPTFGGTVQQNRRTVARNRLIQYGIDCYGAFMSMADIYGTAGHRGAEAKPWILLAGYLTRNSSMLNMLTSFRTQYAATTYASLTDDQILERKFADDSVVFQIGITHEAGTWLRQTFEPNSEYTLQSINETNFTAFYGATFSGANSDPAYGKFAKFTVSKVNQYDSEANCSHCRKGFNYYSAYVKVTSGPGSGDTTYRVVKVIPESVLEDVNSVEFTLDRPWINGTPDPQLSTIKIFGVKDGISNPGGATTDVGRYVYQASGIERSGNDLNYFKNLNISPSGGGYASQFLGVLWSHLLFKPLYERGEFLIPGVTGVNSGLTAFFIGKTWKYISQFVGGTDKSLADEIMYGNYVKFINCPNGENLSNLTWMASVLGHYGEGYNLITFPIWRSWLNITNENNINSPFGYQYRDRVPGKGLTYDATGVSRVLGNFGRTGGGGSDINGDGLTDATDLTFILDRWGS